MELLRIIVADGKLISIPHGMMTSETNVWAQYVWWTGIVASRILPVQNAIIAMSIITPGPSLWSNNPVVTAAQKPERAGGENCAETSNGLWFRSTRMICQR